MDKTKSALGPIIEEEAAPVEAPQKVETSNRPVLQFSVPFLSEGDDDRIRSFVGIFYELPFPEFPTPKFSFFIANGWCNGKGNYTQKMKLLLPDKKTILIETPNQPFSLEENTTPFMAVNFFAEMVLKESGTYWIQVFLEDKLALEYPMVARKIDAKK